MKKELELSELRPRLIPCEVTQGKEKIVLENKTSQSQLVLPKEYLSIINRFDGIKSIEEIATDIYHESGEVSFNSIIKATHLLKTANLLEGEGVDLDDKLNEKAPHEQNPSILSRPIFSLNLIKSLKIGNGSSILLILLSTVILGGVGVLTFLNWPLSYSPMKFLQTDKNFLNNLIVFLIITSGLLTAKSLIKVILLILGTGRIYRFALRLNYYGLSLHVDETSVYTLNNKLAVVFYGISSFTIYFACYSLISFLFPELPYLNDILLISIMLTFLDIDPYRASELSKLFYYFYTESQVENLLPYLRNNSFKADINSNIKFSDQVRFILYGIISFAWAIAFALFFLDIVLSNISTFLVGIIDGPIESRISSAYISIFVLFFFAYLAYDLIQTVLRNILNPLSDQVKKVKVSGKKVKAEDIDHHNIIETLKTNHLFSDFRYETLEKVYDEAEVKTLAEGENLITQGMKGEEFYILISGEVEINVKTDTGKLKKIAVIGENGVIGEQAILEKKVRNANVVALEEIVYLEFQKNILDALASDDNYKKDYEKLLLKIEISQFISTSNLFKDFPSEIMSLFISAGDLVKFPSGHEIVEQGEMDKTFYLIIRGNADIFKDGSQVASLEQGDFFGEIALIANTPRTATVKMTSEALLLYIEGKRFWQLLSKNLDLAMYIESVGRQRMESK